MKRIITTAEAAELAHIHIRHVRAMLKNGTIAGEKIGRDWFVFLASIRKFKRHPTKGRPKNT